MKIVISTKECKETKEKILVDPCAFIECGVLDCNFCPLQEAARQLREAQNNFTNTINSIEREE